MNGEFDFILELSVWRAMMVVIIVILADTVLGILKTFRPGEVDFDIRKLPQFLANNVLPYAGGLIVLALVANFVGEAFEQIFYVVAVLVIIKYTAEVIDKVKILFGLDKGSIEIEKLDKDNT